MFVICTNPNRFLKKIDLFFVFILYSPSYIIPYKLSGQGGLIRNLILEKFLLSSKYQSLQNRYIFPLTFPLTVSFTYRTLVLSDIHEILKVLKDLENTWNFLFKVNRFLFQALGPLIFKKKNSHTFFWKFRPFLVFFGKELVPHRNSFLQGPHIFL